MPRRETASADLFCVRAAALHAAASEAAPVSAAEVATLPHTGQRRLSLGHRLPPSPLLPPLLPPFHTLRSYRSSTFRNLPVAHRP